MYCFGGFCKEKNVQERSDLGNSLVFTGCQLSLSNYNRNLQTIGSLYMGTGNLQRVHKRERTSDFGSDVTCHKCLHQVPASSWEAGIPK